MDALTQLRQLLTERGLGVKEAARAIHFSQRQMRYVVGGHRAVPSNMLDKIRALPVKGAA